MSSGKYISWNKDQKEKIIIIKAILCLFFLHCLLCNINQLCFNLYVDQRKREGLAIAIPFLCNLIVGSNYSKELHFVILNVSGMRFSIFRSMCDDTEEKSECSEMGVISFFLEKKCKHHVYFLSPNTIDW